MDLTKVDLSKIDYRGIINSYKHKIANLALVLFAVYVSSKILLGQNKAIESLKQTKELEVKKNAVLGEVNIFEKKVSLYKDLINKKDVSSIVNIIAKISREEDFKITSLSPVPDKSYPVYIKYPFSLSGIAKDYNFAMKFINQLENDPNVFIVEMLNIKPIPQDQAVLGTEMILDVIFYTILFK